MRLTPDRRVLLALLAFGVFGYALLTWAWQLVNNVFSYRRDSSLRCSGSWHEIGYSCDPAKFSSTHAAALLVTAALLALVVTAVLGRWVLRPVTAMVTSVSRLGPQNLIERTGLGGRGQFGKLSRAIDAMMDRVADAYEGQRRFAANASHELRTPLAVQRTLIEVSMAGVPTPEQLDLLARQLLATNERNEALIEGLLVLAESDRGLAARVPLRLDSIAEDVAGQYAGLAGRNQVSVRCYTASDLVVGELALIERLVANLVHNAIKYNVPGGTVEVRVPGDHRLLVSNSGAGVAAELIPGLFEPFRRLSGDRMDHSGGSGLGLTIARSIAQAHSGRISATGNDQGGLTVEVVLPGAPESAD